MTPATMPAVVCISRNPNKPVHMDSRYPPSVAVAKHAPAAALHHRLTASTASASTNPAITCRRKSHPMTGMLRYPVRYRSRCIAAEATADRPPSPAPLHYPYLKNDPRDLLVH